jgi:pantothenate kinase type III
VRLTETGRVPTGEHRPPIACRNIAPGIGIAAEALFERTAKLPRIDIAKPKSVVGKNTVASMQAGLFYGYLGW